MRSRHTCQGLAGATGSSRLRSRPLQERGTQSLPPTIPRAAREARSLVRGAVSASRLGQGEAEGVAWPSGKCSLRYRPASPSGSPARLHGPQCTSRAAVWLVCCCPQAAAERFYAGKPFPTPGKARGPGPKEDGNGGRIGFKTRYEDEMRSGRSRSVGWIA